MKTVHDLFDRFKGPAAVGRAIGKTTKHASAMRARKSIPISYWPALIAAGKKEGIALDEALLVRIHLPTLPLTAAAHVLHSLVPNEVRPAAIEPKERAS